MRGPEQAVPRPHLVMSPAGFPHAQGFSIRKLSLKAEEDPAVTKKHLKAILPKGRQVLVKAYVHQPQQFSQVHLQREKWRPAQPQPGKKRKRDSHSLYLLGLPTFPLHTLLESIEAHRPPRADCTSWWTHKSRKQHANNKNAGSGQEALGAARKWLFLPCQGLLRAQPSRFCFSDRRPHNPSVSLVGYTGSLAAPGADSRFFGNDKEGKGEETEKALSSKPHQLLLHILIPRGADKDRVLHQTNKAPESIRFIQNLSKDGGHEVRHSLGIANGRVVHCIVQQDPPKKRTI